MKTYRAKGVNPVLLFTELSDAGVPVSAIKFRGPVRPEVPFACVVTEDAAVDATVNQMISGHEAARGIDVPGRFPSWQAALGFLERGVGRVTSYTGP